MNDRAERRRLKQLGRPLEFPSVDVVCTASGPVVLPGPLELAAQAFAQQPAYALAVCARR